MRNFEEIAKEVMEDKNNMDKMQLAGKELNDELIAQLDSMKDKHPMFNMALISIVEHIALLNHITGNLLEATLLLQKHNIPFQSAVTPHEIEEE